MKKKRKNSANSQRSRESCQQKLQQNWIVGSCTSFNCAVGLSGIPDAALGAGTDITLEGGSDESDKEGLFDSTYFKANPAARSTKYLRFRHQLTDNLLVKWDTAWLEKQLYVEIPDDVVQGSRDSLVALLDAAEEHLGCEQVIVCFKRDRDDRAQLIKTFRFMGFELVPPGGQQWIPEAKDYLCMICEI